MFSTFDPRDVTLLLKDISGMVRPMSTLEREARIQDGTPYCEMLPIEYEPSEAYMRAYRWALAQHGKKVAQAVANVAVGILQKRGPGATLVSLARAGITAGILIKRYAEEYLGVHFRHYSVSIVRGVGIDKNAMKHVLSENIPEKVQFVDGWTGKGAILGELRRAMRDFPGVDPELAVLADPARIANIRGTWEDLLIPSSCMNSTICGLLSRTFLRSDIIGPEDYHGAAFYDDLREEDQTEAYMEAIQKHFPYLQAEAVGADAPTDPAGEVAAVKRDFGIRDINHVKPGIGEATRVLLRRKPWKILVHSLDDEENLGHLFELAAEKGVEVCEYPLRAYRACGLIRSVSDA